MFISGFYGKLPYTVLARIFGGYTMSAVARFDLTMDVEEKDIVSRAAALTGTTMAAFVRTAAKEKARELLDRESRITMTTQDFQAFTTALNEAFVPNAALQKALDLAHEVRRV
ncbi:DUF1778 domain-containing protein [Propionivibrio sp.]|uniref:type II toxin-antitoxin system TacA family antitoxin n=1 Tax=Propionivibrio sp. TaxID=2212460 RepID=UPI00261781CA|nr:DUF1778 domain-containing protein [Propionivibrio sp.]